MELVNVGTTPVSEAILHANEIFEQKTPPEDIDKYIVDILNLYKKLYFESLTKLQKEKLNPELIDFIEMRNGLVYDDIFNALYKKILVIKELPKEKLVALASRDTTTNNIEIAKRNARIVFNLFFEF